MTQTGKFNFENYLKHVFTSENVTMPQGEEVEKFIRKNLNPHFNWIKHYLVNGQTFERDYNPGSIKKIELWRVERSCSLREIDAFVKEGGYVWPNLHGLATTMLNIEKDLPHDESKILFPDAKERLYDNSNFPFPIARFDVGFKKWIYDYENYMVDGGMGRVTLWHSTNCVEKGDYLVLLSK